MRVMVTVGLCALGVVYLLIAWIAVQIAWTGTQQEASPQGALAELASAPLGAGLLWVTIAGLFTITIWQLLQAGWGHRDREPGWPRTKKRISSLGRAALYAAIGVSAVLVVVGGSSSGNEQGRGITARLLDAPAGRILVIAIAVAMVAIGVRSIVRGVTKGFTDDLAGGVSRSTVRLGQIGYVAKGIALAVLGVLFGWAALSYEPSKAGGLDAALRTIRDQPLGAYLLTGVAIGFACYGLYCFAWARHAKH